eukprot:gene25923-28257_t
MASMTALESFGSADRFSASTATSNSAWAKPIGWALASAAAEAPVSDDLNGWLGVHQTSEPRLCPVLP